MYATISAEMANQRHAEFVAQAEARRAVQLARGQQRGSRSSAPSSGAVRVRRSPISAVFTWIAAGQL